MNKTSGSDGIPTELFQILKDGAVKVLHSYANKFGKAAVATRLENVFIPIPKKGNAKECSNDRTIALISHASKVMFKILQPGFNSTWTKNFQTFKWDLEKAEEPEIIWILEKAREFQTNIYFCFIAYAKAFDCVDHNKLENS